MSVLWLLRVSAASQKHRLALLGKEIFKLQRENEELEPGSYDQPSETASSCT